MNDLKASNQAKVTSRDSNWLKHLAYFELKEPRIRELSLKDVKQVNVLCRYPKKYLGHVRVLEVSSFT